MEETGKVEVTGGKIDKEVLDVMSQDDVLTAIQDEKQKNRLIMNFFCELLSEIKGLRQDYDEFMQCVSVCSSDKIGAFFKELQKNVHDEEQRVEFHKKMSQSHRKSTRTAKNTNK